jgi:hypothetical protein
MRPLSNRFPDDVLRRILRSSAGDLYEVWARHPDYPLYEVSNWGRVYSHKRGKLLKPWANGKEYLFLGISGRNRPVHQLVLEAFVGPRPSGMEGCHFDGHSRNNRLMNLRWDTPEANRQDRWGKYRNRKYAEVHERNRERRERLRRARAAL